MPIPKRENQRQIGIIDKNGGRFRKIMLIIHRKNEKKINFFIILYSLYIFNMI